MKSRISWLALAPAAVISPAASATTYLTIEQAQVVMFPDAGFAPDFRTLTDAQMSAIERESGVNVRNREVKLWRVSTGGWFIADDVVGKHEFITFAVGLDAGGAVKDIEILDYRESYGDQVRLPQWRAQFTGKRRGAKLRLDDDIQNISGATLSCRHITDGVKRLLSTYAIALGTAGG